MVVLFFINAFVFGQNNSYKKNYDAFITSKQQQFATIDSFLNLTNQIL
jgi:hypothetical protein